MSPCTRFRDSVLEDMTPQDGWGKGGQARNNEKMIRKKRGHEEASLNHSTHFLNTLPVTGLKNPSPGFKALTDKGAGI